jgi:hypothetical protein
VSRHTRPVLILVPLAAILVAGFVSGRGDGAKLALAPAAAPAASPAPEAVANNDVITQWEANAGPVLSDIERDIERVVAAVAEEEPALAVLHCRDASERVAGWSQGLVPAPDAELDRELRAALDLLGRAFDTCSTASLDSIGSALEPLRDAREHLVRARQRVAELQGG